MPPPGASCYKWVNFLSAWDLELCADAEVDVKIADSCSRRGQHRPGDGEPPVHMASDVRSQAKARPQKSLAACAARGGLEQINFAVVHENGAANRAWFFAAFHADHADVQRRRLRLDG